MSYAFDTLSRAWERLRQELPPEHRDGELATRFSFMLEELHDANHRLNDAVNHDAHVTASARRLERALAKPEGGCVMLDQFAMWVGYAVMGAGALAAVGFVLGLACTYAWQKLLKDVPNWLYVQNAVAYYRQLYPQKRWARDNKRYLSPDDADDSGLDTVPPQPGDSGRGDGGGRPNVGNEGLAACGRSRSID